MPAAAKTIVVTGASSGIGEAIARELAGRGFDLVLSARSAAKLEALAHELQRAHSIKADVITADLATVEGPTHLAQELSLLDCSIDGLVNNAGFALFGPFVQLPLDEQLQLVQVNVTALTALTRLLLPAMVQRKQGRILNVASTAAFMPGPLMAVYYASKAYVLSLSEALNHELRDHGIRVTALCPGATASGFQARAGMEQSKLVRGRNLMTAEAVAKAGVDGMIKGRRLVIPGSTSKVQAFLPRLLPRGIIPGIVQRAQSE